MASSTSDNIFETQESWNNFVALISITSPTLIQPDNTSSLILAVLSSDSPVKADVSNEVLPRVTTPSTGILSPFLMTKISPTSMSYTSIFLVLLRSLIFA